MAKKYTQTARCLYFESMKGQVLDHFLSKGWYRMGPSIFTSNYLNYQGEVFSVIWLRTILKDYKLSRSLRKICKKNKDLFRQVIEPYQPSEEIDKIYLAYKYSFKGDLPATLRDYMMESLGLDVYDTRMVKVYSDDKLVACSLFDVGTESIASIFGFYDPAYKTMSLGIYTMLIEIEFCKTLNLDYYYMGYFVPGNPRFDYKLRLGQIEFLETKSSDWLPFDVFNYDEIPIEITKRKLNLLQTKLPSKYKATLYKNAFIDVHIIEYLPMNYVEEPLLLFFEELDIKLNQEERILCTYDFNTDSYKLYLCEILDLSFSNYNPAWLETLNSDTYKQELVIRKTLKSCKTAAPILRWLANAESDSI